jgi:hypothetical protein
LIFLGFRWPAKSVFIPPMQFSKLKLANACQPSEQTIIHHANHEEEAAIGGKCNHLKNTNDVGKNSFLECQTFEISE